MNMRDRVRRDRGIALCLWMACTVGSAGAADSGFYLGADEGRAMYPDRAVRQVDDTTFTGSGLNHIDFTWDLAAGYRFNRYFALQAGYVDLGERSGLVKAYSGSTLELANVSFATKGETFAAIGILPFGKWEAFLEAGLLHADSHLDFSGDVGNTLLESRVHVINTHPFRGLGVGYNLTGHWHLRLGFDSYRDVGSTYRIGGVRVEGPNINTVTFGGSYRF